MKGVPLFSCLCSFFALVIGMGGGSVKLVIVIIIIIINGIQFPI